MMFYKGSERREKKNNSYSICGILKVHCVGQCVSFIGHQILSNRVGGQPNHPKQCVNIR